MSHIHSFKQPLMVVALALTLALLPGLTATAAVLPIATNQSAVTAGLDYLADRQNTDGSIPGFPGVSQWSVLALAAAGTDPDAFAKTGGHSLLHYLESNPPTATASTSEWARGILAITAAGHNPYSFGGVNYVAALRAQYHDHQLGSASAISDDTFGVLALVAAGTTHSDPVLADTLDFILDHQVANGGFGYSATADATADIDDTAAVIMALSAAQSIGLVPANLPTALANAQAYLLGGQNPDGGFYSAPEWGAASNTSSTAWALMSLTSLGQYNTPAGTSAQAYLRAAQNPDGSFAYMAPSDGDTSSTASAINALAQGTWPAAIYEGPIPEDQPETPSTPTPTPAPIVTPSTTPTPMPTGSVLGASASVSPTPTPSNQSASRLPAVGSAGAPGLVAAAILIALSTGVILIIRRRAASSPQRQNLQ